MMLRYVTSTLVASALAGTVSLLAQQQPPASPPPAKEEAPKATLTGCVMEAKTTDGAKAYVLDKAEGGSAKMYVLLGGTSSSDFAANVNKKVEVMGAVTEPSAPAADDAAKADPKVLRPPIVQVESVKVVDEACK